MEADGVLLNDFFNSEILTKIKAEPEKGAKVLDMLKAKVLDAARDIKAKTLEVPQQLNEVELNDSFFFNAKVPTKLKAKVLTKLEAKVLTKIEAEHDQSAMEEGLLLGSGWTSRSLTSLTTTPT